MGRRRPAAPPGRRETGLQLASQVATELEARKVPGAVADQWRLLLAFQVGQAGDTTLAQQLLAMMITAGEPGQQDAAQAVLRAIGGPRADTRLQIILLEAELAQTPADADDLLRLHHALATDYGMLADHRQARRHAEDELPLTPHPGRRPPRHPDHPRQPRILDRQRRRSGAGAAAV